MKHQLLLITPPNTQLNTPYPATAYLKGFLNTLDIAAYQCDLGIEVILKLFSKNGFSEIFREVEALDISFSDNAKRILQLKNKYLQTIDPVIQFLQHKNSTLAHSIIDRSFLPEGARFDDLDDMEWAFGSMGIQDHARHLCTLFLEDIGDLIKETIDPYFGFSRYAEKLSASASSFEPIDHALNLPNSITSKYLLQLLADKIDKTNPTLVCISIPFPGNLFAAMKCGQYIKKNHPNIKIVIGGGYVNTELRKITSEALFKYVDFVSLDDGEAPLQILLDYLSDQRSNNELKRIFLLENGVVQYKNGAKEKDISQREVGTPDYSDLLLGQYLSVIEILNPMHRLWSDGRWNKLTLAHGCYWGKCSFCDISLDYIKNYEPIDAAILCDRIETIIAQTGQNGFHFVDEAAPPKLVRDLALEIIKREITVIWWTNIRFEKSFTPDLCKLLKASGCIAVSGGLEVASDRLLALMEKGVTVAQVAKVSDAFTQAGIMVHAYLMYGFPTQTLQESIDALENVRQLFENGVIQSGFWHRFSMTAHSPVGMNPEKYKVIKTGPLFEGFAENDLMHDDPEGFDHDLLNEGLKKSLFNYMHGICFEYGLKDWFDFDIPATSISPDFISKALKNQAIINENARLIYHYALPKVSSIDQHYDIFEFHKNNEQINLEIPAYLSKGLSQLLVEISHSQSNLPSLKSVLNTYEQSYPDLEEAIDSLNEMGLILMV